LLQRRFWYFFSFLASRFYSTI